ncbi:SCO3933 family regulatory protein [Nonomuraea rhizosphaerae]|uniref:SCO3933 family regulatory protein n=1 Tax=Nonomuraea rhizosphaerae TaxID=2665663 RepID=UPI001C5D8A24|nr:hypothetical protein [Nonomuraea rhizosphaerae]
MRNIPIPVDTAKLQFTCVKAARPRLVNKDTGEIKTDKNGQTVYEITMTVEDESGRIELVKIATSGEPAIVAGQEVTPVDLVGYVWEISQGGSTRWGISYRAASIVPAMAGL